ncbi:MAG TPA: hypothetical protein VGM35_03560 [Xanthobacteraceae bacterium]
MELTCAIVKAARCVPLYSAALILLMTSAPAWPQTPPATPPSVPVETAPSAAEQPPSQPSTAVEPRQENPGLINELGKLFKSPPTLLPPLKTPQQAIDDFNATIKGGSGDLPRWGVSTTVTGHVKCLAVENSGPDCNAAAETLCRTKNYKSGKSVDTEATQSCSAEALLLSGRKSQPGACRTDYFVTRAMCQ